METVFGGRSLLDHDHRCWVFQSFNHIQSPGPMILRLSITIDHLIGIFTLTIAISIGALRTDQPQTPFGIQCGTVAMFRSLFHRLAPPKKNRNKFTSCWKSNFEQRRRLQSMKRLRATQGETNKGNDRTAKCKWNRDENASNSDANCKNTKLRTKTFGARIMPRQQPTTRKGRHDCFSTNV